MANNCGVNNNNVISPSQQHIKLYNGTFVAVNGPNMTHKLNEMNNIRVPYQQVVTSRIILRPGQVDYLLNFLGLGDNATFLAIVPKYDERSKFTNDNYVRYSYYSERSKQLSFSSLLVLSGNGNNRIEQLYLTNPNPNAGVVLEVMIGIIDEYTNYFQENPTPVNPSVPTFNDLISNYVKLWENDNSILTVTNSFDQPLLFIGLNSINSINQNGSILTIDDTSVGQIFLVFTNETQATQARIKINGFIDMFNNGNLNPPVDNFEPIITFTNNVSDDDTIDLPLTSLAGDRAFLADTLTLGDYGTPSPQITKSVLNFYLISTVNDFNGATISVVADTDIIIRNELGDTLLLIDEVGEYFIFFNINDNFSNFVSAQVNVKLNVI